MKRRWIAGTAIGASIFAAAALAQTTPARKVTAYPSKPIRLIVPYPAGGTADALARVLGQKLSDSLGQQVVTDQRPGSGGNLGTDIAAKSPPDGYTLVVATVGPFAANVTLYGGKMPFDPARDFEPVTLIARSPLI